MKSDLATHQFVSIDTFVDDSSGFIFIRSDAPALHINGIYLPSAFFHGQTSFPTITKSTRAFSAIGVVFNPTTFKEFFGIDACEMTDQLVPSENIIGRNMTNEILDEQCQHQQITKLTKFLEKRATVAGRQDLLVKNCIHEIKEKKGITTVRDMTIQLNISERQLEKRFNTHVGISPRQLIKVTRFMSAIEIIKKGRSDTINAIAHSLDYADHAHFIRHVKQLSGFTPGDLFKKITGRPADQLFHAR